MIVHRSKKNNNKMMDCI